MCILIGVFHSLTSMFCNLPCAFRCLSGFCVPSTVSSERGRVDGPMFAGLIKSRSGTIGISIGSYLGNFVPGLTGIEPASLTAACHWMDADREQLHDIELPTSCKMARRLLTAAVPVQFVPFLQAQLRWH